MVVNFRANETTRRRPRSDHRNYRSARNVSQENEAKKEDMKEAVSSERIRENFMYKIPFTSIIRKK